MKPRAPVVFDRLDLLEWQLCQRMANFSIHRPWLAILRLASKLGNWPVWVVLIALQPLLHGVQGWVYLLQYSVTALLAIGVYRLLKTRLCRERPFITFDGAIACTEPAMDRYSFPSGHTMHAIMFCLLAASHSPWLLILLAPLSLLIAISRVGLGLHYLSDVIAGALIGTTFAWASLKLVG